MRMNHRRLAADGVSKQRESALIADDFEQLDLVDQQAPGRAERSAVGESFRHPQLSSIAYVHVLQAFLPTRDNFAERYGDRGAAHDGAIEQAAIRGPA